MHNSVSKSLLETIAISIVVNIVYYLLLEECTEISKNISWNQNQTVQVGLRFYKSQQPVFHCYVPPHTVLRKTEIVCACMCIHMHMCLILAISSQILNCIFYNVINLKKVSQPQNYPTP